MRHEGSVTVWLGRLKAGNGDARDAVQALWERYWTSLVRLGDRHLRSTPRRLADGEDVAAVAFERFCRAAALGKFPRLADRGDLWQVLVVLAERAALNHRRDQGRRKRGGGLVRGESALDRPGGDGDAGRGVEQVPCAEPTPRLAAEVADRLEHLLSRLDPETLRPVALLKLEGCTNEEIAERLGCSVPTVERRVRRVRDAWEGE